MEFPTVVLPKIYIEMDELPDPWPSYRTACGRVNYIDGYIAIIEAKGPVAMSTNEEEEEEMEDFDNYCLCHVLWTTVDGQAVQDFSEKLMVGDIVYFVFEIFEKVSEIQPLHCTVESVVRKPLEIFTAKQRKKAKKKESANNLDSESSETSEQSSSEEEDSQAKSNLRVRKLYTPVNPNWTSREIRRLQDTRVPINYGDYRGDEYFGGFPDKPDTFDLIYSAEVSRRLPKMKSSRDHDVSDLSEKTAKLSIGQGASNGSTIPLPPAENSQLPETNQLSVNNGAKPKIRPAVADQESKNTVDSPEHIFKKKKLKKRKSNKKR